MRSLVVPGVRTWCLGFIPDGGIKIPQLVAKKNTQLRGLVHHLLNVSSLKAGSRTLVPCCMLTPWDAAHL